MDIIIYVLVGIAFFLVNLLLHSKKAESQVKILRKIATHAVEYVEQIATMKGIHGEAKKDLAIQMTKKMLSQFHLKVSDEIIETVIESIVFYLNMQGGKK